VRVGGIDTKEKALTHKAPALKAGYHGIKGTF
jgi:hypothetical protein